MVKVVTLNFKVFFKDLCWDLYIQHFFMALSPAAVSADVPAVFHFVLFEDQHFNKNKL